MKTKFTPILSFLILVFTVFYAFKSQLPTIDKNTKIAENKFSVDRALHILAPMTNKPHYVGSKEHQNIIVYLEKELNKLGLEVNLQKQLGVNKKWHAATQTQNIFSVIKGTDPNAKALLLLSHYDSSPHSSLGASDAGSGVVAILEGLRAYLTTNPKPKNDIIILFTDAEEVGLLGADAFVNHNALIDKVGLVLNFEARGSGGPSYMLLETNGGNKKLIKAFNKAKPNYPVGNSLMYSIYKMLPNDTDLTVFREDGNINGFNFAFIDDHYDYHTAQDSYDRLDRNTLQQQGDYLLTLLTYFADADLNTLNSDKDNIYFNFPKLGMVNYPFSWNTPLFIVALILFFVITFIGVQRNKLTTKSMFAGFVPFLLSLIITVLLTVFGWKLLQIIHPQYKEILHGFTYNGHLYIFAFSMLTVAISLFIYKRYLKLHTAENLLVAPIFIWGILNFFFLLKLQGAGFFILPVYFGLLILTILLFSKLNKHLKLILISILMLPVIVIFVPFVKMFPVGLGLKMLGVSAFLIVFLLGLFIPVFKLYGNRKKWQLLFFILAIFGFVSASIKSGYNKDRKQPTSLVYFIDSVNNKAYWASYDTNPNQLNKEYLGKKPNKGSFINTPTASKYLTNFKLYKETRMVSLPHPIFEKKQDTIIGENRLIKFVVTSQRNANRFDFVAKDTLHFIDFKVNGVSFTKKQSEKYVLDTATIKNILMYFTTKSNEELEIEFSFPKNEKPFIDLYETSFDLFDNPLLFVKNTRDETMMPTPFVVNDATIIKTELQF